MKRIFTLCIAICTFIAGFGQTDTTGQQPPADDTIRIGGMVIIRKAGAKDEVKKDKEYKMRNRRGDKPSNLSTNWWIIDLGFSSFKDETNRNTSYSIHYTKLYDLKEELDILLQYKLEPDASVVFNGKEELIKVNGDAPITLRNYEEWLVLYLDNELTPDRAKTVEQFINDNPAVKQEFVFLQKARLQPETIIFPYKESLYRKEEKPKVVPFPWIRVAAAVLIIALGITSVIVFSGRKSSDVNINENVAKTIPAVKEQQQPVNNNPANDSGNPGTSYNFV